MGMIIGPTSWWQANLPSTCPVGTTLPDGSRIFCKAGGRAWIVAPSCTQVGSQWAGGQYNNICVTTDLPSVNIQCINQWSIVQTQLITCGFNPCDWFVPNISQLTSACLCKNNWDSVSTNCNYWSSTETNSTSGFPGTFANGNTCTNCKACSWFVRAIRCVTY